MEAEEYPAAHLLFPRCFHVECIDIGNYPHGGGGPRFRLCGQPTKPGSMVCPAHASDENPGG